MRGWKDLANALQKGEESEWRGLAREIYFETEKLSDKEKGGRWTTGEAEIVFLFIRNRVLDGEGWTEISVLEREWEVLKENLDRRTQTARKEMHNYIRDNCLESGMVSQGILVGEVGDVGNIIAYINRQQESQEDEQWGLRTFLQWHHPTDYRRK